MSADAMPTDRWIDLSGACNVRDLGGLPLAEGGSTRRGMLFRSDALDRLRPADVATLRDGLGLRHVIDLRSQAERDERGRGLLGSNGPDGTTLIRYTEVEVITIADLARRSTERARAGEQGLDAASVTARGYVELLELGGSAFRTAIEAINAANGVPALFHCSAGKDRTGVLAALLLAVAGVERSAIVADYALTEQRLDALTAALTGARALRGLAEQLPAMALQASAATMERFLDLLDGRYGGPVGYLERIGVGADDRAAIRSLLVEHPPG